MATEYAPIVRNISWLMIDRAVRLMLSVAVLSVSAKALAPEGFGAVNYVISFVTLFSALSTLGVPDIVIKDYLNAEDNRHVVQTSLTLCLMGSAVLWLLCNIMAILLHGDRMMVEMIVIFSFVILLRATNILRAPFDARLSARSYIRPEIASFTAFALLKIVAMLTYPGALLFLIVSAIEALSLSLIHYYITRLNIVGFSWRIDMIYARNLIARAWPSMLSAISIIIYMKIDQVMLGIMQNNREVGIYAGGVRVVELAYLLPVIFISSTYPVLVKRFNQDPQAYETYYSNTLQAIVILSIVICAMLSFAAGPIIHVALGDMYSDSVHIFRIYVWSLLLVSIGMLGTRWLIIHKLYKTSVIFAGAGAIFNVAANLWLIPRMGATGAAVATLLSYALAAFLLDACIAATRMLFIHKLKSVSLFTAFGWIVR